MDYFPSRFISIIKFEKVPKSTGYRTYYFNLGILNSKYEFMLPLNRNINQTLRYAKVDEERKKDAIDKLF